MKPITYKYQIFVFAVWATLFSVVGYKAFRALQDFSDVPIFKVLDFEDVYPYNK